MKTQKEIEKKVGELTQLKKETDEQIQIAVEDKVLLEVLRSLKIKSRIIEAKINALLWSINMNDEL